jgi:hypothetical protein
MRNLTSRTTLITAVAIAGVLIAGTAAVAANIGILNASKDDSIGSLAATDDLVPSTTLAAAAPMVVEVAPPAPTTTEAPTTTVAAGASYVVDDAGTVSVSATPEGLVLLDAAANPGWTPVATQPDPVSLRVAFDNGTRTVVFTATLGTDGTIVAEVTEPIIVEGAAPSKPLATPTTSATSHSDDDRYESDEHDDDSHEYDDDSHEYEGADDDD